MAKRSQFYRVLWLAFLLVLAFAGLGYRLVDLQMFRHDELTAIAQQNTHRQFLLEPRRGDIMDAKGHLLATSVVTKNVRADPVLIGSHQTEVVQVLAPLLQTKAGDLAQRLAPRVWQNANSQPVTNRDVLLKARVPVETWQLIQAAMTNLNLAGGKPKLSKDEIAANNELKLRAIFARDEEVRDYPNQTLAAHVLGYANSEEVQFEGHTVNELSGRDGIEFKLDSKLKGVRGWRLTEADHHNRELVALREQDVEPRDGLNVVLTIDSVVQNMVESALAEAMAKHSPISVSGIVVRPRTGEILALATLPNFDPNAPGAATEDARRNRVVTDRDEPGSTFKIVVVSGALNDGTVRLTDLFDCEHGHWSYAKHILHDHKPYDTLSVEQIITKSSNIGAAKIGLKMGAERLAEYIHDFGFGSRTGIPLPAEAVGIVHPEKWGMLGLARIPMGQGISVTRLQMVMAMCAIANNGVLMQPMLVNRLEDRDHNVVAQYAPQKVRQVISEATAKMMVTALKTVVLPGGTAPEAALEHYTVAGKTGTANKVEDKVYVSKYFSSFIGFFPADNPEICISVTLDDPKGTYYGGEVAAPVFKQIAERAANYLNIRPEDGSEPLALQPPPQPN
jgi:cell division protein FtsI/penicillin-binding protein 2